MHHPSIRLTALVALGLAAPASAQMPGGSLPPRPDPVTWHTDYNTARKAAQDKNLPLLLVIGTDNCFYCRKLEATSFRDPAVSGLLANGFVPLKIDANREPALAKALKVQVYPTLVLAAPDGKIHAFIEGYLEADRLAEQLRRAATATTTADWMARDYNEASKAIGAGDYPRAVSLLKGIVKEAGDRPVGAKAQEVLDGVERQAAGRLARGKELDQRGYTTDAMDTLADVVKVYAGTQAAADAANVLAGLADRPEAQDRQRARRARDLLALAKEEFRTQRYYDCLQKCEQLADGFAGLPEAREAASLAAEVKTNPDRLAVACEQMNEKTAAMYLALADSWMKKGQEKEAIACLDKVTRLCPGCRPAELAQVKLAQIQGKSPATPAGFQKP